MEILSHIHKPRGVVRLWRRGELLWERDNLIVNSGLTALASLLGGTTVGEFIAAVGFGSGTTTPALTDVGLTANPAYYNATTTVTIGPAGGVAAGSVQFSFSVGPTDFGATPLNITELGFFGNTGNALLPAAVGTANPVWQANHLYSLNNLVVDSNGNIQRVTTGGTSGGSTPSWSTQKGGTTPDGTAVWTLVAFHTAPTPLIGHLTVPLFPFSVAGIAYTGTYTVSM